MSARYRSSCRHCWDPVDSEGDDACAWCALSPAERRRWQRQQALVIAIVLGILLVFALIGVPAAR